jgi:hypothetical protein
MASNSDQLSNNPFVEALRGNDSVEDSASGDPMAAAPEGVAAATVEAMAMGDQNPGRVGAGNSQLGGPAQMIGGQPDSGRMEAVVDLLFGNHLNEINASMRALEKQVAERVNKAEGEMRTRIESIDRHTKGEIDSLNKMTEKERGTRDDTVDMIGDRVDTAIRQMEMRLEKMEGEFARNQEMAQKDLEQRLAKAADATMLLREGMEQEIGNMKVTLSTRSELGAMFTELGKRLEANASGSGLG